MKYLRRLAFGLLPVALLLFGWSQRYNIHDWWRLRGYTPSASIVKLADDTAMNDHGRKLFYVNHPQLNNKAEFNQYCNNGEQSIVLGCYVSGQGIFVYDVQDKRLLGVHQVTAAHEMLHAAYERLGSGDKSKVDELTAEVLAGLKDKRITTTVDGYRQRDPSVVPNELHSILATEVVKLPKELEDYYKRYFKDRQAVVKYSQKYESAFEERQARVASYDKQLADLKKQIAGNQSSLDGQFAQLTSERQQLETLAAAKDYDTYNSRIPGFNQKVRTYNSLATQTRSLITSYNAIVAKRNAIALEENELVKAIDSRPGTIKTE